MKWLMLGSGRTGPFCQRWEMFHSSMPLISFGSPTPYPGFKSLEMKTWFRQTFESFIAVLLIQFSLCWLTWKNYFLIPFCEQTCEQFEKPIKRIKFWWRGKNAFLPIERIFVRWQSNLETETVVVGEFNFFKESNFQGNRHLCSEIKKLDQGGKNLSWCDQIGLFFLGLGQLFEVLNCCLATVGWSFFTAWSTILNGIELSDNFGMIFSRGLATHWRTRTQSF